MQYAYKSIRGVIGQVIRNTRLQDSSYIADIHEWIFEAMAQLETQETLVGLIADVPVRFHKGKLPCGIKWIDGVAYNGQRLQENRSGIPAGQNVRTDVVTGASAFVSTPALVETVTNHLQYTSEVTQIDQMSFGSNSYYTEMGYINTTFSDGVVQVCYRAIPTDTDGMPLIPDNANYKQALYWYCRAMLIGSGWPDKVFTYNQCLEQFEKLYAPRAISEIRYPSPEQMEHRVNTFARFIPSNGYYDSFFQTDRPEASYDIRNFSLNSNGTNFISVQQPTVS